MGLPDTFWDKVDKTEDCWNWVGAISTHGYGKYRYYGSVEYAHRVSYEEHVGFLPDVSSGYEVDHLCRNRRCVNPDHLEMVTHWVNCMRGAKRGQGYHNAG